MVVVAKVSRMPGTFIARSERHRFNPFNPRYDVVEHRYEAREGGKIVGYATVHIQMKPPVRTAEVALYVAPEHRQQGVGSEMMAKMLGDAKEDGIRKVWLRCYEDNAPALALYFKFGFKLEGRFENQEWDDLDRPLTILSLGLLL